MNDDNHEKSKDFEVNDDMKYESVHVRVEHYSCKTDSMGESSKCGLAISIELPNQPTEATVNIKLGEITNRSGQVGAQPCMCCSSTTIKPSEEDEPRNKGASRKHVKDRVLGLMGKIPFATQIISNSANIWEFVIRQFGG